MSTQFDGHYRVGDFEFDIKGGVAESFTREINLADLLRLGLEKIIDYIPSVDFDASMEVVNVVRLQNIADAAVDEVAFLVDNVQEYLSEHLDELDEETRLKFEDLVNMDEDEIYQVFVNLEIAFSGFIPQCMRVSRMY